MAAKTYHLQMVGPIALTSLLLVLCTVFAVYLYSQQTATAEALGENIGSRQAAGDLEQTLSDLAALHRNGVPNVEPLHRQVQDQLDKVRDLADKPRERELVEELVAAYGRYLHVWRERPRSRSGDESLRVLAREVIPACQSLRSYNASQIELSEQVHRRTLRHMAWGLAAVAGFGSLAGLFFGYAVARGFRRSIHRLSVHIADAAGKLGQDLPTVVLTPGGDFEHLHEQMRWLVDQIERVVQELGQREREVLRAEQLAAVGQLAAGVAHEIRNPLTSIKMLVQAYREEAQGRGIPAEDLQVIEGEIRRLERTLKTFLDFARPPRLERALLDLADLVERTLDLVRGRAARQKVQLAFDHPPEPVPAEVDGEQMRQVLVNLALNALDAMPQGGRLEIGLRPPAGGEGMIELRVADTGQGISPAVLPRLFEPFVSGKETGLGLGLVVSRRIVEDHGGTLRAYNRRGGGACFTVRVPARAPVAVS
jgi:two-component system, NtrC family, sensor histidine kinase HydH